MAFESLTERFQSVFKKMRKEDRLTEKNMEEALREIKVALLESDVNFKVVKAFLSDVKEKALGSEVTRTVSPSEQLIKICHDEITSLLGGDDSELTLPSKGRLTTYMMVGLQGTGKTTSAAKLAYFFQKKGFKVLLTSLDVYRPAAVDQLRDLAKSIGAGFHETDVHDNPRKVAAEAKKEAAAEGYDALILDTAGRLQIDEALMNEIADIAKEERPDEALLLIDASAGQDAVNVAKAFNDSVRLTGVIVSKLDGDAKGGSALSIKYLTGLPIKLSGTGEKVGDLEAFHPERMAERILGMGDIVSLVEKAQEQIDEKEAEKAAKKMMSGEASLEDMLKQMKMVQRLGSLGSIASLIPGMPKLSDADKERGEKEMKTFEAVINSMTPYERRHPDVLRFSQKNRIAKGSGKTNADINRVLKRFEMYKKMMSEMKRYQKGGKFPPGGLGGLGGLGGRGNGFPF